MPPKRQSKKNATSSTIASLKPLEAFLKEQGINVDLNDFLKGGGRDLTNEERAQDLFYEAMEAKTIKRADVLVKQALELDPDNADARVWMLGGLYMTADQRAEKLRDIVEAAARKLGAETFKNDAGNFWGFIETRPYMRARAQLAGELIEAGRMEEAAKECEGMLELNPNDNQGMRYTLLTCYLSLNKQSEAQRLFKQYNEDSVVFAWGKVLLCWLSPNKTGLEKALAEARKANAHVECYLTGKEKIPKKKPPCYSMGSKEEAICYAESLVQAWNRHPEALTWLREKAF